MLKIRVIEDEPGDWLQSWNASDTWIRGSILP
jgi:hypothetical protein